MVSSLDTLDVKYYNQGVASKIQIVKHEWMDTSFQPT